MARRWLALSVTVTIANNHDCTWHNVHGIKQHCLDDCTLDDLLRDALLMSSGLFHLIYPKVNRWRASDNTIRVSCSLPHKFEPIILHKTNAEHTTNPRKKDFVEVVHGEEKLYGSIAWIDHNDDQVGIFLFKDKELDTFPLSCLETVRGEGKTKWRIS